MIYPLRTCCSAARRRQRRQLLDHGRQHDLGDAAGVAAIAAPKQVAQLHRQPRKVSRPGIEDCLLGCLETIRCGFGGLLAGAVECASRPPLDSAGSAGSVIVS
jgi:hypothetical protein